MTLVLPVVTLELWFCCGFNLFIIHAFLLFHFLVFSNA